MPDEIPKVKNPKLEMNVYVLVDEKGIESGAYKGRMPRQAALKAANDSNGTKAAPVTLKLRQRGTKKIHIFRAWKEVVPAPAYKPAWMKDKINKPFVQKVGVERPDKKKKAEKPKE